MAVDVSNPDLDEAVDNRGVRSEHCLRSMMLCLLTSLLLFDQAAAQQPDVTGAKIIWYGTFQVVRTVKSQAADSNSAARDIKEVQIAPPKINSDQIKIIPSTNFGFGYTLIGAPESAIVTVKHVRKVPAPGIRDRAGQRSFSAATEISARINSTDLFVGGQINDIPNFPPGVWTLQVWFKDKLLVEKDFTLLPQ